MVGKSWGVEGGWVWSWGRGVAGVGGGGWMELGGGQKIPQKISSKFQNIIKLQKCILFLKACDLTSLGKLRSASPKEQKPYLQTVADIFYFIFIRD